MGEKAVKKQQAFPMLRFLDGRLDQKLGLAAKMREVEIDSHSLAGGIQETLQFAPQAIADEQDVEPLGGRKRQRPMEIVQVRLEGERQLAIQKTLGGAEEGDSLLPQAKLSV